MISYENLETWAVRFYTREETSIKVQIKIIKISK